MTIVSEDSVYKGSDLKLNKTTQVSSMGGQEQEWVWSPREKKCLNLLQQRNTRATILQIHAFMLRSALETNLNLLTKFITTCSSVVTASAAADPLSGIHHARQVFDKTLHRYSDTYLCNSMIKAHLCSRQYSESVGLYKDLKRETRFSPDGYTFLTLVKSCSLGMHLFEGEEIHNHALKIGFRCDLFTGTALIDMYSKFGKMGSARNLFDEMIERNEVSWTALISGYARCGNMINARELFYQMPGKDTAAFNMMIDACVKLGDLGSAKTLFDEMPQRNVVSWTSMIDGFCSNGDVDSARSLFNDMPEKNIYSWNAMIGGYCQNKQPREALNLFHELQTGRSLEPDSVTIVSVLPAIADLGALDIGSWVHQFVIMNKLDRTTNVCTALVDMYAKCGEITKARKVFDKIPKKEIVAWNALINGLAINGRGKEALDTFVEMTSKGINPNDITMIGVLSACNHCGLVNEGRKWFKAISEFKLTPRIEHYGCLIDLLGRAGCLQEAEDLINSMPFEVNGIILSSFLFACGYANDVERGERVLKKVSDMEPLNDGNYIMLRNLYATKRRWVDVEEVKGLMRKNGAKKEVGCSVVEVDNRVSEFVAGANVHPKWTVIRSVVGQLSLHMKGHDISTTFC